MIDKQGRGILAKAVHRLEIGRIKWAEFDNIYCSQLNFEDKGLSNVANAIWTAYDPDFPKNRPKNRKDVAKVILFLKSDLEYDWQDKRVQDYLVGFIDIISGKIFNNKLKQYRTPEYKEQGDTSLYPFKTKEEFEKAKKEINILGK